MRIIENGIEIDEITKKILLDRILDIEKWILDALEGQINYSTKEMIRNWMPILLRDDSIDSIPKNTLEVINLIFSRPYYKDRKERDKEIEKLKSQEFSETEGKL